MLDNNSVSTGSTFELSMVVRDADGNPIRRLPTKGFDSADKLSDYYHLNKGKPRRKTGKKVKASSLPKKGEAEKILAKVNEQVGTK